MGGETTSEGEVITFFHHKVLWILVGLTVIMLTETDEEDTGETKDNMEFKNPKKSFITGF